MSDIKLRKTGRTGRITLCRPDALNAVTHDMVRQIAAVLPIWAADDDVAMIVIDAEGDRAFSAGGDLMGMYQFMRDGAFEKARLFWREEYAMNAALFHFPKPVASFMQGFTMGGGVGVGCHCSHRVVGESARVAMPECGVGLAPDVGGTLILARAPGSLGEYLGVSGHRMHADDAIYAGFADHFIPETQWPNLIADLEENGDCKAIALAALPHGPGVLAGMQAEIDAHFAGADFQKIVASLRDDAGDWATGVLDMMSRNAPLAMATTIELVRRARKADMIETALTNEYRFSHRVAEQGDFREGIRAMIIDKDKSPKWAHDTLDGATSAEVLKMLAPLGKDELILEEQP